MAKRTFWVIAGTSDGRRLVEELLSYKNVCIYVSVATEYGAQLLPHEDNVHIIHQRMDYEQMLAFLYNVNPDCVIDATHPYAQLVTDNISKACAVNNTEFFRLYRPESECSAEDIIHVQNTAAAVQFLQETSGNVFLTTGSKELQEFCVLPNYQTRIYARVLPMLDSLSKALELGFAGKQIICMQGPFSLELNKAMLQMTNAAYLVTKSSGQSGGFTEKLEAANELGAKVIVIGRPPDVQGLSIELLLNELRKRYLD